MNGNSFTRVTQDEMKGLEASRGGETPMNLADEDTERRESATGEAAARTLTE